MTLSMLTQFLEHLGWSYQPMSDSIMMAEYKGLFGIVRVLFHLREAGLCIAINPVLEKPLEAGGWGNSVGKLIVALNQESPSIRIGMDKAGDLFVKIEIPNQKIDFGQFTYVLLNLCQVSEQLTVPVLQAQAYDHFPSVS